MSELAATVVAGAPPEELLACPVPDRYRAAYLRREDSDRFSGGDVPDVRRSIRVGQVPMPALATDEVLIAVMASSVDFNAVAAATFRPTSSFEYLAELGRQRGWAARHDQRWHVVGSDASGVVVRVGDRVQRWAVGDRVVVAPAHVDIENPLAHEDGLLADHRTWGYQTNFGGLADFAIVKGSQLLPKPAHLSWEESACNTQCVATAYRMLVSPHGASMKQGDVVLVWGAAGGLGGYAVQLVLGGGGIPIGVVTSGAKQALLRRLGCTRVIDRRRLPGGDCLTDQAAWQALSDEVQRLAGEAPHIVLEHTGAATFDASIHVVRNGGTVVTCGFRSGYHHRFDSRQLWMGLKRIVGSKCANYQEAAEANRLVEFGRILPTLSQVYSLERVADALRQMQLNQHVGKLSVRCLAPADGLGIDDPHTRRDVGEDRLRLFRGTRPGLPSAKLAGPQRSRGPSDPRPR